MGKHMSGVGAGRRFARTRRGPREPSSYAVRPTQTVRKHRFVEERRKKRRGTTKREWPTGGHMPTVGPVLGSFALGWGHRGLRPLALGVGHQSLRRMRPGRRLAHARLWPLTLARSRSRSLMLGSDLSRELARSTPVIVRLRYVLSRDYVRGVGRRSNGCLTCVRVDISHTRDAGHGSPRLIPYGRPRR